MNKSTPTGEQKLDLAKRINASFDAWCDEMGVWPDAEILVLALYARTSMQERSSLLVSGLR